ncbi:hypothetical protein EMCRGX_G028029 [Ephydatia muelleri]
MGTLGSEQGVHQGDPLGPLLFSLVLQKLVRAIAADKECSNLLFNRWYLDDGTLAGPTDAVKRAIQLIQQIGPPMGLRINATKCELISQGSLEGFPADMKRQHDPNVEILGAPIGDLIFCAKFLAQKQAKAVRLLSQVAEVGSIDPQIALLLLRQCASFCKLVHVACSTPPSLVSEGLALFDGEVRCYFSDCVGIDASDAVWQQVQLSLSRGGLGLGRLELHCSAAYLASVIKTSNSNPLDEFSTQAVSIYNSLVPQASSLSDNSLLESGSSQKKLSAGIENHQFDQLCATSTPANRARLLSASSRHASSWLAVIPSRGLNLCMEPEEFQVALKWWLGMDTSPQQRCPHCHDHQLDPLGHHAVTCKGGGDAVIRHNALRDVFAQFCHRARLGGQLEVGYGSGGDVSNSRPADFLVSNWTLGKPAAFDLTVVSPLNSNTLIEAGATSGSAAGKAEVRKHNANDPKCRELGWVCIPLAVESYGCWGEEAHSLFSRLAACLALQLQCSKSKATTTIYQRLNLTLVRCNARAMLSRARLLQSVDGAGASSFALTAAVFTASSLRGITNLQHYTGDSSKSFFISSPSMSCFAAPGVCKFAMLTHRKNAAISSVDRIIAVSAGPVLTFNFTPIIYNSSGSSASTLSNCLVHHMWSALQPIRFPQISLPGSNALWRVVKQESPPQCGTTTCLSMQRVLFLVKYPLPG